MLWKVALLVQYLIAGSWSSPSGGHISFKLQPFLRNPESAHICHHTATNMLFGTEGSTKVIWCRRTQTQAISCQKKSLVRWASALRGWSCDPHGSESCSFVHKRDADDHNGDADLPPGQMLSRTVSAQPHRSMWSQRGGTDGGIAFWWFHAFLHKMTHVSNSVDQLCSIFLLHLFCSFAHICECVLWSDTGRGPL